MLHTILTKIRQKIINNAGCAVARWILHNCDPQSYRSNKSW